MRTLSKCKLFLCIRPVVDIDAMLEPKVSQKHGLKKSDTKSLFFQQAGSTKFSESWIMNQPPKKTLARMIKAVVSETILKRRAHQQKNLYLHDSFGSKHSYGSETKTPQSPLSSSSSSHGSTSPYPSSPKALSSESKNFSNKCHPTIQKQNKFECNGIYLVLISLLFTVIWGKLFGIILTSMWLYLFSLLNSSSYCSQKRIPSYYHPRSTKEKSSRGHYYYGRS